MKETTREKLMHISVATIATALFKRGLRNQVIQDVHPVGNNGCNMVGPAFTLRYMPAREDRNQIEVFETLNIFSVLRLKPALRATCL